MSQKNLQEFNWALQTANLIIIGNFTALCACMPTCIYRYICVSVCLVAGPAIYMHNVPIHPLICSCIICDSMHVYHLLNCMSFIQLFDTGWSCLVSLASCNQLKIYNKGNNHNHYQNGCIYSFQYHMCRTKLYASKSTMCQLSMQSKVNLPIGKELE